MDLAHKQTLKMRETTNKQLKSDYLRAYKSIRNQFIDIYSKIEITGDMTSQEKLYQANKYSRIENLSNYLVEELLTSNVEALKTINNNLKNVYQSNYNFIIDEFKKDGLQVEKINKTETKEELKENANPYNEIAEDVVTDKVNLKRSIKNSLTTSILNGLSPILALSGIKKVYERNLESCVNIAQTQITRIENLAKMTAMKDNEKTAEKQGYVVIKVWRNSLEHIARGVVRDAHARAEGQEAELDKPFYVGGEELMYPGDISGSPANIINCGCWIEYKLIKK